MVGVTTMHRAVTITFAALTVASAAQADIIYATGYRSGIYEIDTAARTTTRISNDRNAWAIAGSADPSTIYLARSNGRLRSMDVVTGNIETISNERFSNNSFAFATDGNLYSGTWGNGDLYRVDPTTGFTTYVGNTGLEGFAGDLAPAADGNLYGLSRDNQIVTVNTQTAATTVLTTLPDTVEAWGIAATYDGRFWVSAASLLYEYDLGSGTLTEVMDLGFNAYDLASTPGVTYAPVPTPAAASLMLLGFGVIVRRRRA